MLVFPIARYNNYSTLLIPLLYKKAILLELEFYEKKKAALRLLFLFPLQGLFLFVTAVELINSTCSINKFHLTSVEWVRCV